MADTESPIATVTVPSEAPVAATNSIASSSSGKAISDVQGSGQGVVQPAAGERRARPAGTPIAAPTTTAPTPTTSAIRAPTMSCVNRSRPSRSVPSQWSKPGPSSRRPDVSLGSYGSHSSDTSATRMTTPTHRRPAIRSRDRRSRDRRSGGRASDAPASSIASGRFPRLTAIPCAVGAADRRDAARRQRRTR